MKKKTLGEGGMAVPREFRIYVMEPGFSWSFILKFNPLYLKFLNQA